MRLFILGTQESAPDLRRSLSQFEWIELCGYAFDRREGAAQVLKLGPDVIVLSNGPWDTGYAHTVREIRRVSPSIKIVVISDPDDARTKREARDAGATVYIATSAVWTSLMSALRKLERRLRGGSSRLKKSELIQGFAKRTTDDDLPK